MPTDATASRSIFAAARHAVARVIAHRWCLLGLVLVLSALSISGDSVAATTNPCPTVPLPRLSLPATAKALSNGQPITIVALGSSSTAGVGASSPAKTYPSQLEAALRAAWPGRRVSVVNAGIGGDLASQSAARIPSVLMHRPVLVIWQSGANELLSHMPIQQFEAILDAGVAKVISSGADVVLMDSQIAPMLSRDPAMPTYQQAVASAAARHRVSMFSRSALMQMWHDAGDEDSLVGPDGLHHTDRGYACVANALARSIIEATRQE